MTFVVAYDGSLHKSQTFSLCLLGIDGSGSRLMLWWSRVSVFSELSQSFSRILLRWSSCFRRRLVNMVTF